MDLPSLNSLLETITTLTEPLTKRMNALFYLRTHNTPEVVPIIEAGFHAETSDLFRHEACYVLGQLGFSEALPFLIGVIENAAYSDIVRHEAAEALGAIGDD